MGDSDDWDPDVVATVRKYALQNAVEYDGAGQAGSVLGRLLGERADLRSKARDLKQLVEVEVNSANALAAEQGVDAAREALAATNPEALEREKQKKRIGLKELPNATQGKVILRFAPNPNGPLTLGHARGVSINSEYANMYDGKVVLRYDDTDSRVKPPLREAYDWIESDYKWLTGRAADVIVRASDRMPVYLEHAERMLAEGFGYVCRCTAAEFKELRDERQACPCRSRELADNLSDWKKMNEGEIGEGKAVVRVKTDLELPNPALRDWPALRIQHSTHPMVGDRYKVWPLLDFQSAIEDHEQGVTHIIRGKDLMDSTRKQTLLYAHFGWEYPETLYWGRVKIHGFGSFSTSGMRADIADGKYSGWDDARLPTLRSLRRRGFDSGALRAFWIDLGLTQKDISISLQTIEAFNSSAIDAKIERRSFVRESVELNLNWGDIAAVDSTSLPRHPDGKVSGERIWKISNTILIEKNDADVADIRLKDFADIEISDGFANVKSIERSDKRQIVHWLAPNVAIPAEIIIPEDDEIKLVSGMLENVDLEEGKIIQLERVGFARIETISDKKTSLIWLHN